MSNATNLAAVFDEHPRDEFELHDASATMTTMCERPHLHHLPTMAGGNGGDEVFRFYPDHFVTKWPHDTLTTYVSRAIGDDQLVYSGPSLCAGASGTTRSCTSARERCRTGPKVADRQLRNESVLVSRTHTLERLRCTPTCSTMRRSPSTTGWISCRKFSIRKPERPFSTWVCVRAGGVWSWAAATVA